MAWRKLQILKVGGFLLAGALTLLSATFVLADEGFTMPSIVELRKMYAGKPETWPKPWLEKGAKYRELGPLPAVKYPENNQPSKERADLGQKLFDSPILSESGQFACSSCHNPELDFGDGIKTAFGHDRQRGNRNSPHLFAVAWQENFFWDGRAKSLEEQAMGPIQNPIEMAAQRKTIENRLNKNPEWKAGFKSAYGIDKIRLEDVARALANYERTLKPRRNKWDLVFEKQGIDALNDDELKGLHLFRTKARCMSCHNGPLFTDDSFHNLGLTYYGRKFEDKGRFNVTSQKEDMGRFKTPSLRGVSRTGPYMHNGLFPSLEGVINIYDAGAFHPQPTEKQANDPLFPVTDEMLVKLNLSDDEKQQILAYLKTL
ncbi:cytochrome-c peroxidase [Pseudaquidulcibacter saccharophilus]|uniref:cytochrome-c peroxidase n=1 Tax=Pseudaquidulcibacter saccharophilus TaxID=2831900 RepID=UPI001EFF09EF|nr:cytochrome c peroxidase [Pseudaquidulcibacter saccharophilus]